MCGLAPLGCGDERPASAGPDAPCTDCADSGVAGASAGGGAGDAGPDDGRAGNGGSGGQASADAGGDEPAPPAECGNAIREADEECDGADFGEQSCASFGFSDGALGCVACVTQATACSGTEICSDGADNDGDAEIDCTDADCSDACADFCSAPTPLSDGVPVSGELLGHRSPVDSSCGPDGTTGQVIFAYESPLTGVAELFVGGADLNLAVSARAVCDSAGSELACSAGVSGVNNSYLTLPVVQGEPVYVVVESPERDVARAFQLTAIAHEVVCGDAHVDLDEECDDGNVASDDGCSDNCEFQSDESEPNSTLQQADPYSAPGFFGRISSDSDVDIVAIEVAAGQKLIAETFDLGDGACGRYELDNRIEVLDSSATSISLNDDGGIGFCAALVTDALAAGTYYVRVRSSGVTDSFLYQLSLRLVD